MKIAEGDEELLKAWVIKRIEDISDADSDVLAEYVLALVKSDEPDTVAKANAVANLQDFLQENSDKFVDEVFDAISTKAYDPSVPQAPKVQLPAPSYQPPATFTSRKRGFDGDGDQSGQTQNFVPGDRPMKQPRRGGRGGFEQQRGGRGFQPTAQPWQPQQQPMPAMPQLPAGMSFDINDPNFMAQAMQQMQQMQQIMGMPAMPAMPGFSPPNANGFTPPTTGQRCRDYDTKGYCALGAKCPYEHGNEVVIPNNEYDPSNATLLPTPTRTGSFSTFTPNERGRGGPRGRGRGRGGGKRAEFSHTGQNHDRSIKALVVEQIPQDKFDEGTVRDFFGQFGKIENIDMQAYRRLAVVHFSSYDEARAAYDSPKVVFDNRFVKVYWYKPETLPQPPNGHHQQQPHVKTEEDVDMKEEEPQLDPEEVVRQVAEAQRKHEEAAKKREEAEKQKADIDVKLKAMEAERKKMAALLAKKSGKAASPVKQEPTSNGAPEESEQTKALKAQLAKLEEEAKSMGIDPVAAAAMGYGNIDSGYGSPGAYRGRGGYSGRAYTPRGRGGWNPSYRGGYGAARGGAVKRLDNRPKTICITFTEGTYDQHEGALKQYLLITDQQDHSTLSKHPDRADAALVAFEERYRAEIFMNAAKAKAATGGIPHVGQVELGWVPNAPVTNGANGTPDGVKTEVTMDMDPSFDVADDDDRWG